MKKINTIFTAAIFSMLSATAFACPKGTTMTDGTGPNHQGGKCVATVHATKHQANHERKAEHKMMRKDQMMKTDHKAATATPNTSAPQATMHESMHENTSPEKQASKP